jgi:hypothetical protein
MAALRMIGNAFGTVGGAIIAPFDGGKAMETQAKYCKMNAEDAFDKDTWGTKVLEHIPGAGKIVENAHRDHGNTAQANRAAKAHDRTTGVFGAASYVPVPGVQQVAMAGAAVGGAAQGIDQVAKLTRSSTNSSTCTVQ